MSAAFLSPHWHRVANLRPRLRHHVRVHRHRYRGTGWYVLQDDLAGRQHRFTAAVYLLVGLLDGKRTVDDAWHELVDRLADAAPSQDATIQTIAQLHAADLLQTDLPPVTAEMLERRDRHGRAELWRRFGNPLSLKVPVLDPDRFLARTIHLVRPLFSAAGFALWLALVVPALVLAAVHWTDLSQDFTDRVLATESLLAMTLVYPFAKLLHESGHAYAVKRWDGAVHELGLMLLMLLPVPYVDASASAAFRGKWSRIAVGAAGMMAETALASVAMAVWLVSEPGTVRSLAYAVMVTAGVGTVLFNANPLMRLDGYYILTDLIEMPNLAQRSGQIWRRFAERILFGQKGQDLARVASGTERIWCFLYLPLSFTYRLTVMFGIGVFIASHFFYVGVAIALWSLSSSLLWPVLKGLRHVLVAPALDGRRARAVVAITLLGATLGGALLALPLPLRTSAEGVVWLPEGSIVRASEDGFVARLDLLPGTVAHPGQPLFALENQELAESLPVLHAQTMALEGRLAAEQVDDRVAADVTREELRFKDADLKRSEDAMSRLTVRSATDGLLVVPGAQDLPGRFVKRGEVLGFVTPAGSRIVRVVVTQADVELVRHRLVGAALMVPGPSTVVYPARLIREVPAGSETLPSSALGTSGGGRVAIDPRDGKRTLTLARTFQFDLELSGAAMPDFGQRVLVRFDHGSAPLGRELYRRLRLLVLSHFDA